MWELTSANSASMVSRSLGTTWSAWGNNSKYISYVMLNADGSFSKNAMSFLEPAHLSSTSALMAAAAALMAASAVPAAAVLPAASTGYAIAKASYLAWKSSTMATPGSIRL